MNKDNYPENMPEEFKPIRPWGYVGYFWLFAIPIVGLIFMIIYAVDDTKINRRNLARGFLWNMLIGLVLGIILSFIIGAVVASMAAAIASHALDTSTSSLDSLLEEMQKNEVYTSDYEKYNELYDYDEDDYDYDDDDDYMEQFESLFKEYKSDEDGSSISIDANDNVTGENSAINIGI